MPRGPRRVKRFTSEVKMSACALVKHKPPPLIGPQHKREECGVLTLTPSTQQQHKKKPLASRVATVAPATSSRFADALLIWPACRTHMSQWREINLRARRCRAGDSCGLRFHQMSSVANLASPCTYSTCTVNIFSTPSSREAQSRIHPLRLTWPKPSGA